MSTPKPPAIHDTGVHDLTIDNDKEVYMHVYDIYPEQCCLPLTVIAESHDEAEAIYTCWREALGLGRPKRLLQVAEHNEAWLADHPQLAQLAIEGTAGVAYWLGHRDGWILAQPDEMPRGDLQPEVSRVELFVIAEGRKRTFLVFGTSPEHAMTMFLTHHEAVFATRPYRFTITPCSPWRLTGEKVALREQMDAGLMGVAAYSRRDGWRILPPGDDRVDPH